MTHNSADIEPILKFAKNFGAHIDHGHFVGLFSRQVVRRGRADLACAEN